MSEAADAGIRTDPVTLNALLLDPDGLDAALATGAAEIDGDVDALRRLLAAVTPARFVIYSSPHERYER